MSLTDAVSNAHNLNTVSFKLNQTNLRNSLPMTGNTNPKAFQGQTEKWTDTEFEGTAKTKIFLVFKLNEEDELSAPKLSLFVHSLLLIFFSPHFLFSHSPCRYTQRKEKKRKTLYLASQIKYNSLAENWNGMPNFMQKVFARIKINF